MPPAPRYEVELRFWRCRLYGDRWVLSYQGQSRVIRGTEAEARAYADEMRWSVRVVEEGSTG